MVGSVGNFLRGGSVKQVRSLYELKKDRLSLSSVSYRLWHTSCQYRRVLRAVLISAYSATLQRFAAKFFCLQIRSGWNNEHAAFRAENCYVKSQPHASISLIDRRRSMFQFSRRSLTFIRGSNGRLHKCNRSQLIIIPILIRVLSIVSRCYILSFNYESTP